VRLEAGRSIIKEDFIPAGNRDEGLQLCAAGQSHLRVKGVVDATARHGTLMKNGHWTLFTIH